MGALKFFMFVVALPALIALGHDAWLFYENQERGFMLSTLGFAWTRYHPDSYKMMATALEPAQWEMLKALLAQKSLFIGLALAGVFYAVLFILKLAAIGPFAKKDHRVKFGSQKRMEAILNKKGGKRKE